MPNGPRSTPATSDGTSRRAVSGAPKAINISKKAVLVAEAITQTILERQLEPGLAFGTETDLIEQYGVGRATIREALRLLETEGLISVRSGPKGGVVVQRPPLDRLARLLSLFLVSSGTTLREIVAARRLLEPLLSREAALRADSWDVDRIVAAAEPAGEASRSVHACTEFHTTVVGASKNSVLNIVWFAIRDVVSGTQRTGMQIPYDAAALRDAELAHQKIARAIAARDAVGAEAAMLRHMQADLQYIESVNPALLDERIRFLGST